MGPLRFRQDELKVTLIKTFPTKKVTFKKSDLLSTKYIIMQAMSCNIDSISLHIILIVYKYHFFIQRCNFSGFCDLSVEYTYRLIGPKDFMTTSASVAEI